MKNILLLTLCALTFTTNAFAKNAAEYNCGCKVRFNDELSNSVAALICTPTDLKSIYEETSARCTNERKTGVCTYIGQSETTCE